VLPLLLQAFFTLPAAYAAERFVNPAHPAASDSGPGSATSPYRTLGHAARSLRPGDTLTIAPGVYRESLSFPEAAWGSAGTVVQGASGAEVLIKGSDAVAGWEPAGGGVFVKRGWSANSQQVFVDGRPLRQIGGTILNGFPERPGHPMAKLHASQGGIWPGRVAGGRDDLVDGSFFYDAAAKSLTIKVPLASLEGHTVEASVRPFLIQGKGLKKVTLRNLRLQHANTTAVAQSGAVTLLGEDLTLERIEVTNVDGAGFDLTGERITVRDSRANDNGQVGMKVRGRGNRLIGNETSRNNTRGFNKWWEAGGAKFVGGGGLRDSEVSGHRAIGNHGDGLWFDWMNRNNRVHGNVVAYNAGFGIHYEASQKGSFTDNYVFANGQRGIYLPNCSECVVERNLVAANRMEGIVIVDERKSARPELLPRGNRVVGNIVAWNGRAAVVLPANGEGNVSDHNVYVDAKAPPLFSLGWATRERPVRKGLEAWKSASGQDANSRSELIEVPPALMKAWQAREIEPDWSALTGVAAPAGPKR